MIRGDFRSRTTADRLALYDAHADKRDRAWYEQTPDRLIRLEDTDGNFVADKRTLFSDAFDKPLDGIGFSILAEKNATYFTCIPALRKLTDTDDDGVADTGSRDAWKRSSSTALEVEVSNGYATACFTQSRVALLVIWVRYEDVPFTVNHVWVEIVWTAWMVDIVP